MYKRVWKREWVCTWMGTILSSLFLCSPSAHVYRCVNRLWWRDKESSKQTTEEDSRQINFHLNGWLAINPLCLCSLPLPLYSCQKHDLFLWHPLISFRKQTSPFCRRTGRERNRQADVDSEARGCCSMFQFLSHSSISSGTITHWSGNTVEYYQDGPCFESSPKTFTSSHFHLLSLICAWFKIPELTPWPPHRKKSITKERCTR